MATRFLNLWGHSVSLACALENVAEDNEIEGNDQGEGFYGVRRSSSSEWE